MGEPVNMWQGERRRRRGDGAYPPVDDPLIRWHVVKQAGLEVLIKLKVQNARARWVVLQHLCDHLFKLVLPATQSPPRNIRERERVSE